MSGILSVLLAPTPAVSGGNIAFITGAAAGSSDGSSVQVVFDSSGSDLLIIGVADLDGATRTVSDDHGNTLTALTDVPQGVSRARLYFSKPSSVGAGHTILDTGTGFPSIAVAAFSGSHATPFDVEATGTGSSAAPSAGAGITPTQNNCLVVALVCTDSGLISAVNAGFTIVGSPVAFGAGAHFGIALAWKIQTSAAAVDPDWTNSVSTDWAAAIASFRSS